MQLARRTQAAGAAACSSSSSSSRPVCSSRRVCCPATSPSKSSQAAEASTSAPAAAAAATPDQAAAASEVQKREFMALGSKVVETNVPFTGPEDEKDFWEGDQFDAFGKALENYFIPGLIVLGLVCGATAAKFYNDDATAFLKPAPGPDAEASIIIAIPDTPQGAPSPSS